MLDFRFITFLKLCKLRSYTETAKQLNITQPTVTGHIQYLEQLYGVKLFCYEGKKLLLTEEGEYLLNATMAMQSDSNKIKERLKVGRSKPRTIRIGATLTIGEFVLPEAMKAYLLDNPTIEVTLVIGNTSFLLEQLKEGKVDCAFVEGYFNKKEFRYDLFMVDEFVGVCSKFYQSGLELKRLEETLQNTIILREKGSGTREILERTLHENGLELGQYKKQIEFGNINVIKYMVENNMGISFLYRSAVQKELNEGRLQILKIKDFNKYHEFNFVVLKDSIFIEEHFEVVRFVKNYFELNKDK